MGSSGLEWDLMGLDRADWARMRLIGLLRQEALVAMRQRRLRAQTAWRPSHSVRNCQGTCFHQGSRLLPVWRQRTGIPRCPSQRQRKPLASGTRHTVCQDQMEPLAPCVLDTSHSWKIACRPPARRALDDDQLTSQLPFGVHRLWKAPSLVACVVRAAGCPVGAMELVDLRS